MSETAEHAHAHPNYWKIYWILLALLVVSVTGPMLGHPAITLVTAFGIAIVKAFLVAKNFMHVNIEPKWITYLLTTMLVFMLLFFTAAAPDVMAKTGSNWKKPAWLEEARAYEAGEIGEHGAHGGAHAPEGH